MPIRHVIANQNHEVPELTKLPFVLRYIVVVTRYKTVKSVTPHPSHEKVTHREKRYPRMNVKIAKQKSYTSGLKRAFSFFTGNVITGGFMPTGVPIGVAGTVC